MSWPGTHFIPPGLLTRHPKIVAKLQGRGNYSVGIFRRNLVMMLAVINKAMEKLWKEKTRFEKRVQSFRAKFWCYEAFLEGLHSSEVIDDAHDYSGLVGATATRFWLKR